MSSPHTPPPRLPGYAAALVAAAHADAPQMRADAVSPESVPEPQRSLLVHTHDMTPTLERHHAGTIFLQVLQSRELDGWWHRHSILMLHQRQIPVALGLIRIRLAALPPAVAELVRLNRMPLGALLHQHRVPHACHPGGYYRISGLGAFAAAIHQPADAVCFGRANVIRGATDTICEILEVLPSWD